MVSWSPNSTQVHSYSAGHLVMEKQQDDESQVWKIIFVSTEAIFFVTIIRRQDTAR